jgi:hypothetical protein
MSFQAYLDNIKAKTGKTPNDFRALAKEKGLVKSSEIVAWLKTEFVLVHGHANAILRTIVDADDRKVSVDDKLTRISASSICKFVAMCVSLHMYLCNAISRNL